MTSEPQEGEQGDAHGGATGQRREQNRLKPKPRDSGRAPEKENTVPEAVSQTASNRGEEEGQATGDPAKGEEVAAVSCRPRAWRQRLAT